MSKRKPPELVPRPALRYHGGKWRLAPWIVSQFPPHRVYVEPFGGAASVLMRKQRSRAEIYNELDGEIVNVFRILRDPDRSRDLERLIRFTPFAREEFERAFEPSDDPLEQARRTILKSFAGYGSDSIFRVKPNDSRFNTRPARWTATGFNSRPSTHRATTGFRADSNRSGTTPARDWIHYPDAILNFCHRLQGVVIVSRPALDVIRQFDGPDTLFYVDPPYVRSARKRSDHGYRYEMTDDDHRELAEVLRAVEGAVIVSGYATSLYEDLFPGWRRLERSSRIFSDSGKQAIEVLWISPDAAEPNPELWRTQYLGTFPKAES